MGEGRAITWNNRTTMPQVVFNRKLSKEENNDTSFHYKYVVVLHILGLK